jgi:hypothetical protein|eukprot:COSAG03_NODE_203_length_10693_cov_7.022371_4_plen_146_part_00
MLVRAPATQLSTSRTSHVDATVSECTLFTALYAETAVLLALRPHHETLAQENWHCPPPTSSASANLEQPASKQSSHSHCDADGVYARMDWTSFTLGPSQGAHPVTLNYEGLDPEAEYELSVLFFSSEYKVRRVQSPVAAPISYIL